MRRLLLTFAGAAIVLKAQSSGTFDVASIRYPAMAASPGEGTTRSRIDYTPNSLTMRNVNLGDCVQWAWNARFYQVSVPDSLNRERYDILAKTDRNVPLSTMRTMLQSLLTERLNLVSHREMKLTQVYLMALEKNGLHLPPKNEPDAPVGSNESTPRAENGNFIFPNTSMKDFAEKLSDLRGIECPVIDRTSIGAPSTSSSNPPQPQSCRPTDHRCSRCFRNNSASS